jgi:hypothetical protein
MQFDSSNSTNAGSMYLFLPIAEREIKKLKDMNSFFSLFFRSHGV